MEIGQEPLFYGMQHLENESVHNKFATDSALMGCSEQANKLVSIHSVLRWTTK
jgi:hypothetical protein